MLKCERCTTAADIEFKKKIYKHMHQGLSNIQDVREVFAKGIDLIRSMLDQIEEEISRMISAEQTIVIKEASFFENEAKMNRALQTIVEIDKHYQTIQRTSFGRR